MGQFNPFYRSNSGGGGGGSGSSEVVRYKIEKSSENSKTVFKLKQSINGVSSYVGDIITFDAADISFDSEKAQTVEEALNYLLNFTEGNYNFTTFQELGIDTSGKTMEQILSEVLSKNLPVNTIITGQIYKSAAPDLGWNNAEAKIQITEGGVGQQIYWCSVSSIEVEPYQWNSIYYEKQSDGSIQETLGWTPTYYELPTASKNEKGGILVGDTLTIDSNGVLNINLSNIKSIEKIEFTSSTGGDTPGIAGATDTYTITLTDNTTYTFDVYNGNNGGDGHTHENKDVLDKLGEQNVELTYNGEEVFRVWHGTKQEYDALSEKSEDWTYIITDDESSVSEFTSELKRKLDGIEEGANNYVHPDVSGTKTQYGEISVNDFTISISNAPFKFGDLANASQCGVPIENAKGEHSLCANSFTSTSECAESSSAFGYATKAGAKQQFVAGRYNAVDEGDIDRTDELYGIGQYVFILGNGLSPDKLSNALAVDWKGNIFCDGDETSLNAQIDANTEKLQAIEEGANKTVVDNALSSTSTNPVQNKVINAQITTLISASHTHSNKDVLDEITSDDYTNWQSAKNKAHTHSNKDVLDDITSSDVASWNLSYIQTHEHENKDVLDGITAIDTALSSTSTNPVQNKTVKTEFGKYLPLSGGTLTGQLTGTTFAGALSGNASTATKLKTARKINGASFDGTDNINTAYAYNLQLSTNYESNCYTMFARTSDVNLNANVGATILFTDAGDFGGTRPGAWIIQLTNRGSSPSMHVRTLIPHNKGTVQFGYYHDTTNGYFYFGVYTTPYRASGSITVLRNVNVEIKNYGNITTSPSGWTAVTPVEFETKSDSGWKNLILGETGQIVYRKIGSLVEIKGQYKPATSGGGFTIGTMPEGYRPSTYKAVSMLANEANNMFFLMRVRTNGDVNISGSNATTFTQGTIYDLHIQYFID